MDKVREQQSYILDELRSLEGANKELSKSISSLDKTVGEFKVSFENHVASDEKMYEELKRMNDILSDNTASLQTHIKRTDLLEQAVMKMDVKLTALEVKSIGEEAIKKWLKDTTKFVGKVCAALAALTTAIMAAPAVIKWLISLAG